VPTWRFFLPLTESDIALDFYNCPSELDLSSVFVRSAPVQIDVGSGKGTFILNQARAHPDINFLGIEWANKYYRYSLDRICRWQMENVRIARADVRDVIGRFLPAESIDTFHIYFPDPWPKKRHHKRRFFNPANLLNVIRCLTPGGFLRTATDHQEYFQVISDLLLNHPQIAANFRRVDFLPASSADEGEWVGTNFERKYLKENRQFYTLALQKI